jgi:regulatory protein
MGPGSGDDPGRSVAGGRARRRPSLAERREERAAVDDPEIVLGAGLRFLETRSRSVAEVRRRLTQAGYRADLVEGAIGRLLDIGILDDEVFGRLWIESRDRARPRGERALRQELALKGIDRQLVDQLLGERSEAAPDGEPDETAALRVLAKHARALARVADPRQRRQRAYALLARNGFDPETCTTTVRQFIGSGESAEE